MATKHLQQPAPSVVMDASTINLGEIASRWKFRPNGTHRAHTPTNVGAAGTWGVGGATTAPPDLRSEFLKLRADLLRREPLMGQVSSIESELATTIDMLRKSEQECRDLRLQAQDTQAALTESQRQVDKQAELIARLQRELFETRSQLDEEKATLQRLRSSTTHPSASPGMLTPQGSLLGSPTTTAIRSTPVTATGGVTPPAAAHRIQRASSPGVTTTRASATRSPGRAR